MLVITILPKYKYAWYLCEDGSVLDALTAHAAEPSHPQPRSGLPIRQNGVLLDAVVISSWYEADLLVVKVGLRQDGSVRHLTCSKYYDYEDPAPARPPRDPRPPSS